LFNQLVAGGVIRGIKIVGTNEQMIYDGAFRVRCGPDYENHQHDSTTNPLGISKEQRGEFEAAYPQGFLSTELKILEYKYSVDGLVTDLNTGDKKQSEIDLIVAWEMGEDYESLFSAQSLLVNEGESHREYHGVTHILYDETGQPAMYAIILKDLISFLNFPSETMVSQEELYG
jgi:hypothetical protein